MACVYVIENLRERKVYVGASQFHADGRMGKHRSALRNGRAPIQLQGDWNRLGARSFEFRVIEEGFEPCDISGRMINESEQYWMDAYVEDGWRLYNKRSKSSFPSKRWPSKERPTSFDL